MATVISWLVTVCRDGKTDIHGIVIRPTSFDPKQKYPVLEHIYAGPHSSFVPKSFGLHSGLYAMAELGFIVVKIDGMGTSNRSKTFHDVCWQNLSDSGFPDRSRSLGSQAVQCRTSRRVGLDRSPVVIVFLEVSFSIPTIGGRRCASVSAEVLAFKYLACCCRYFTRPSEVFPRKLSCPLSRTRTRSVTLLICSSE